MFPAICNAGRRDNWLQQDLHVSRHSTSWRDIMFICAQNHRNKHVCSLFGTKTVGGKMSCVIRQLISSYNTQLIKGK